MVCVANQCTVYLLLMGFMKSFIGIGGGHKLLDEFLDLKISIYDIAYKFL